MTISKDLQERIDYYEKQPRLSFLDSHPDAMDKHLYNIDLSFHPKTDR